MLSLSRTEYEEAAFARRDFMVAEINTQINRLCSTLLSFIYPTLIKRFCQFLRTLCIVIKPALILFYVLFFEGNDFYMKISDFSETD